ncbi:MAG: hypothetical protein FWH53_06165 [Leptospirales bacterium]|nr:hypothetical protein [Leptospirales bacterium]
MTEIKKRKLKRVIFPIGVFFLLFFIESIIGIAGVSSYIYSASKKNIADIESYTINYSKTMAEAFAKVAEFSYSEKKYTVLKALFHEKIEENTIDEAFFVLKNGNIVVHSSTTTEKKLKGNIANDEISYNIDMILQPVHTKSHDLILNNYNITDKFIPFRKRERDILSKYIYENLNTTGWLFTKCIFHKGEPIGTVNFIISKERLYTSIRQSLNLVQYYSILVIAVSAIISFFISLIVFFRYRAIQLNALQHDTYKDYSIRYDYPPKARPKHDSIKLNKDYGAETFRNDFISDDFDDFEMIDNIDNEEENVSIVRIKQEDLTEVYEPRRSYKPKKSYKQIDDEYVGDEYITVEFLGEIESEKVPAAEKKKPVKIKEYIAPVININHYKKTLDKEIRDAIPMRRKR